MNWVFAGMAAVTGLTASALFGAGIAQADPIPKQGNVCRGSGDSSAANAGSQAFTPDGQVMLCPTGGDLAVWTHLDAIQRPAASWYTYGPAAVLTAADVEPERLWIGYGGDDCSVSQLSTAGGPPVVQPIQAGAPYTSFKLIPDLATLTLTGSCDWRTAGDSPYGP